MIRRAATVSVGGRATAGLAAGALLLGAVTGIGLANEHRHLPSTVAQLTDAVVASADVMACFQGVQDDLYIDAVGDFDSASVAAAHRRLGTCPVAAAVRADGGISLPDQPLIEFGAWTQLRTAVASGRADLRRAALDIRATASTMASDLASRNRGQSMIIAYQAAYADYLAAQQQDSLARITLSRLTHQTSP